jgi:hypothetical protein
MLTLRDTLPPGVQQAQLVAHLLGLLHAGQWLGINLLLLGSPIFGGCAGACRTGRAGHATYGSAKFATNCCADSHRRGRLSASGRMRRAGVVVLSIFK